MHLRHLLCVAALILPALSGQTFVLVHDGVQRANPGSAATSSSATDSVTACATLPVAVQGMPVAGAGSLSPLAFMNPACLNRSGQFAMVANLSGSARNQGVFVVDAAGAHPIAVGCGQGGGSGQHGTCGDPSPLGGTFAGFFGGTVFAPPINDHGDVLFLADVVNGSAPRALFLFRAATASIVKVAAVGDPSPLGGSFAAIGPGSLNNYGEVAFLALRPNSINSDLFLWRGGVTSRIAAVGDPAPGGGTMALLGTESFGFTDGTTIPAGPVPAINDCGQIAFRVITQGGVANRGIVVRSNGVDAWYLKDGDPTPVGGRYLDFQGAALNGSGKIAVFTDYYDASNQLTSGWVAGEPGSFRSVLSFYDAVDGGQCMGLAFSRNPMTSIDDAGNVVLWCNLASAGNMARIVVSADDGTLTVLARQGSATPLGGVYGSVDAWPSIISTGRIAFGAGTPGGSSSSAYFAGVLCGPGVAASPCAPLGGALRVDDYGPGGDAFMLLVSMLTTSQPVPPFGTLLIGPSPLAVVAGPAAYPGNPGPHTLQLPLPNLAGLQGLSFHFQSVSFRGSSAVLTNRASTTVR